LGGPLVQWVGQAATLATVAGNLPTACRRRQVLEVSFGQGTLLPSLARTHRVYGIDLNRRKCLAARDGLTAKAHAARLAQARVERLPFPSGVFDSGLNTMAFSGYPQVGPALGELMRVLEPGGRLIQLDFARPGEPGLVARAYLALWTAFGEVIRRMDAVLENAGLQFDSRDIAAGGSLQLCPVDRPTSTSTD
jgi:ubiquinone/menaquinone biosynthesis C-methylase UbiE